MYRGLRRLRGWLVTLLLVLTSSCSIDSRVGNTAAGRFSPLAAMRSCLQEVRQLGARIDAGILYGISILVLERRFKHMSAKRSEMWSNSHDYWGKLSSLVDEAEQKKQELLSQAEEKFADYEKAYTGKTQADSDLFLAEIAKQTRRVSHQNQIAVCLLPKQV